MDNAEYVVNTMCGGRECNELKPGGGGGCQTDRSEWLERWVEHGMSKRDIKTMNQGEGARRKWRYVLIIHPMVSSLNLL